MFTAGMSVAVVKWWQKYREADVNHAEFEAMREQLLLQDRLDREDNPAVPFNENCLWHILHVFERSGDEATCSICMADMKVVPVDNELDKEDDV